MEKYFSMLQDKDGLQNIDFADGKVFKYIKSFALLSLKSGEKHEFSSSPDETGVLILEGRCDMSAEGSDYKGIGSRKNVFDGLPAGAYIPRDTKFSLKAGADGLLVALCRGKSSRKTEVGIITPDKVKVMQVGKDNWKREVRIIIGPDGLSENLILGETINPPGNWSGTPPHKHEEDNLPKESLHEELYYFRTDKPQGFGIEKFYSPARGLDHLVPLKHGTLTYMPWGYHQIVAGPGYTLYYLFFLSGEGKQLTGIADAEHKWINE